MMFWFWIVAPSIVVLAALILLMWWKRDTVEPYLSRWWDKIKSYLSSRRSPPHKKKKWVKLFATILPLVGPLITIIFVISGMIWLFATSGEPVKPTPETKASGALWIFMIVVAVIFLFFLWKSARQWADNWYDYYSHTVKKPPKEEKGSEDEKKYEVARDAAKGIREGDVVEGKKKRSVFRKPLLIATILTALFLLYIVLTNIFSPGEAYTPIISWVWAENIEWRYVWTTIFVFAYILFALTLILTAKNREKMVGEVGKMTLILGVVIFVIVPIADKLYQWLDKGIGYTRVYHSPTPTPAHATSTVTIRPQSEQTAVRPERQEIETVEAPPSPGVSRQVETWALQEYYFWVRPREPVYVRPIYPSHKGEWVFYTPQDYATGKLDFGWPIALEFQSPHGRPVEVTVRRSRSLK